MININTLWLSRLSTTKTSCWSNPLGSWHLNEPIPVKLLEKNFPLLETALSHIQPTLAVSSPSIALRWAKNQLSPFLRRKHFPWNGLSVAESRGSAERRQQKMYGPRSGDSPSRGHPGGHCQSQLKPWKFWCFSYLSLFQRYGNNTDGHIYSETCHLSRTIVSSGMWCEKIRATTPHSFVILDFYILTNLTYLGLRLTQHNLPQRWCRTTSVQSMLDARRRFW